MNFSWDKISQNLQDNALSDGNKKGYEADERFYKLSRDENHNGGALIRFLTDPEEVPFIKLTKINAQQGKGKPFIDELSPQTIGKPDPVNEKFSELWKAGLQEEAKKYGRKFRYYANIKVLKDPANPENQGKVFLFDMSPTLFDKVKGAAEPSEAELALDGEAKEVFNPVAGNSFLLKVKMGSNKILTYEDSKFAEKVDGIYATEAEAVADIEANAYKLSEFLDAGNYLSYDELKQKLAWFDGEKAPETKVPEAEPATPATAAPATPKAEVPTPAPAKKAEPEYDDDLDAALDDLLAD